MHTSDEECTTQKGRLKHSAHNWHTVCSPRRGMPEACRNGAVPYSPEI